jgi:hypothetical protein
MQDFVSSADLSIVPPHFQLARRHPSILCNERQGLKLGSWIEPNGFWNPSSRFHPQGQTYHQISITAHLATIHTTYLKNQSPLVLSPPCEQALTSFLRPCLQAASSSVMLLAAPTYWMWKMYLRPPSCWWQLSLDCW